MYLSNMIEIEHTRTMIEEFRGYNHNLRIAENEFYDMQNLTSDFYPLLSPRKVRGTYAESGNGHTLNPLGMVAKDSFCYVDGEEFVFDQYRIDMNLDTSTEKQLISMGAYVIIMPDKKYINTKNITDYGNIEASFTTTNGEDVTFSLCQQDGNEFGNTTVSDTAPSAPSNLDYWIDTSTTPHTLKQYSATSSMWVQVPTTYIKIAYPNIAASFKDFDGVKISGIDSSLTQLQDLNDKTSVLWKTYHDEAGQGAGDYVVVIGILDVVITQNTPLTIARTMPTMDFVIESENRLWGCRYGVAANGEVVNEIYASKLGDFTNWNCFMGISTDSYAASCGTDGAFTGAIAHLGYPLFFKETCLHKVYGNYPSNYQIQTITCRGVQRGCSRSLAIVNEVLYYKARSGVMAYDGSLPADISTALGNVAYSNAVAGGCESKYYISMKDTQNIWHLFVYDAAKGMWHREDNTHANAFCFCREELYFIENGKIRTMLGSGTADTTQISWIAETGVIGTSLPDAKYMPSMVLRLQLSLASQLRILVQYDSCGQWEHLMTMKGNTLRSFTIPIRPQRCDHFRLRLEGIGECKLFSIAKTIEQGSDM